MSEYVKNMVDAAINQDAAEFINNFENAVNAKVAARLDAAYPEVAHSVMNPNPVEVETNNTEE